MTRAQRLRALLPAVYRLYWRAESHAEEHRAGVLLSALGIRPFTTAMIPCEKCCRLTPAQWLAT